MERNYSYRVRCEVKRILIHEFEEIEGMEYNADKIASKVIKKHFSVITLTEANKTLRKHLEDFIAYIKSAKDKDEILNKGLEEIALLFLTDIAREIIETTFTFEDYKKGLIEDKTIKGKFASDLFMDLF